MYKVLIFKLIRNIVYVTICLSLSLSYGQNKSSDKKEKAKELVKELGANSYKQRKKAIQGLIELGYFARAEVEKALNSDDPEVKENAKLVWDKIRWAVTENNPELVNEFIRKYKAGKVNLNDWVSLVEKCGADSVDVILELNNSKPEDADKDEGLEEDPFDDVDPFEDEGGPFDTRNHSFGFGSMLPTVIYNTDLKDIISSLSSYDDTKKKKLASVISSSLSHSGPYMQSQLLQISAEILGPQQSWKLYQHCDVTSKYIRRKLSNKVISYAIKNFKKFNAEGEIRTYLLMISHGKINTQQMTDNLPIDAFHQCASKTQKTFFDAADKLLTKESRKKLLTNGSEPWHKYRLMALEGLPDSKKLIEIFSEVFNKGGDIVEFIQENFPMGSEKAIPFQMIASEVDNKNNNWFLYSTSTILTNHFHRVGDFQQAIKFLRMFNDENERQQDNNEAFYADQDRLIKDETRKLLVKAQSLKEAKPKEALEIFEQAEKLNPKVFIIKIQKLESLIELKQLNKAKEYLKSFYKDVPDNLIEIRDLVYLSWELDAKDIAKDLVGKLNLDEENYGNITLASSSFEFFLDMAKTKELQNKIGLNSFAQTRHLFYEKNYDPIPALCEKPDEGDFQYIWGVMALQFSKNKKDAPAYFAKRQFDDLWPEMLGLSLIGKISPEEIIEEATSVLNLTEREGRLTEAYYYAACYYLSEGNKNKTKEYLKKSLAIGFYEYYEYVSSKVMLQKLD